MHVWCMHPGHSCSACLVHACMSGEGWVQGGCQGLPLAGDLNCSGAPVLIHVPACVWVVPAASAVCWRQAGLAGSELAVLFMVLLCCLSACRQQCKFAYVAGLDPLTAPCWTLAALRSCICCLCSSSGVCQLPQLLQAIQTWACVSWVCLLFLEACSYCVVLWLFHWPAWYAGVICWHAVPLAARESADRLR